MLLFFKHKQLELSRTHTTKRRLFWGAGILATAIFFAIISFNGNSTVSAAPTDNGTECAAAGGTWGYHGGSTMYCKGLPTKAVHPTTYARSVALYNGLRSCITRENGNQSGLSGYAGRIYEADAISGNWWISPETFNALSPGWSTFRSPSFLATGNEADGNLTCNKILAQGLEEWGYTNAKELLCDADVRRANVDESCANGTGDFDIGEDDEPAIAGAIRTKASLGVDPKLKDEHRYAIYYAAFTEGCAAVQANTGAGDRNYTGISIVNEDGSISKNVRFEGKAKSDTRWVYTKDDLTEVNLNCDTISQKVTEYSEAFSNWIIDHPDVTEQNPGCVQTPDDPTCTAETPPTSCAIDGIGWMVCGLMRGMAAVNDAMYGLVEGILLTAPLQMYQTDGVTPTPQYQVWQAIRDIANVLLVVAFLIIIFSQATSVGISSYGIKKMLPRIILAAIAINLSFFVMMLAVDLANLIGVGLHNFVGGVADTAFASSQLSWTDTVEGFLTGATAAAAAAAGVGLAAFLGGFSATALGLLALPFIIVAILALLAAVVTLFLRNAFIIVLVIISPLAFAAYLLPNTESLFTKWRKAFIGLLMLFPTAALLFAGAKLAAYAVMGTEQGGIEQLFALFIMAAPLFMLPWLAKSGGGLLSVVGDRLQKLAQSAKAPLQKGLKPFVDRERANYRAGNAGWTGRRYQDPAARGRRNLAQVGYDKQKNRDNDTQEAEHEAEERHYERGLHANTRDAERTRAIRDRSGRNKDRTEAVDKLYEGRTNQWRTQTAEGQAVRDTIGDADKTNKMFEAQQQLRQARRTNNDAANTAAGAIGGATPNTLGNVSRQQYAATKGVSAVEKQIQATNAESGVANRYIQMEKAADLRIGAVDKEQEAVFSVRKANDAALAAVVVRQDVAERTIDTEATEEKQRLEDNAETDVNLRALSSRKDAAAKLTEATIKERDARLEREAEADPALVAARQRKENAEADITANKAGQQAELDDRKLTDPVLAALVAEEDAAKRLSTSSAAQVDTQLEQNADTDPALVAARLDKERAEAEKEEILSGQKSNLERRKGVEGDLFDTEARRRANEAEQAATKKKSDQLFTEATTDVAASANNDLGAIDAVDPTLRARLQNADEVSDIATSATARAENLANQEFADRILTDPTVAQQAAGVDPNGVTRVTAIAAETQRKARDENVAAIGAQLTREAYNNTDLQAVLATGVMRDGTPASVEQREAVMKSIVASTAADPIAAAVDYVASLPPGAPETIQLQQSLGAMLASSSAKPKFVGGSQLDALKAGTLTMGSDQLVVATANAEKLSKSSFSGMDIDEMTRMARVLSDPTNLAGIDAAKRPALATIIANSILDTETNGSYGDREVRKLNEVIQLLDPGAAQVDLPTL